MLVDYLLFNYYIKTYSFMQSLDSINHPNQERGWKEPGLSGQSKGAYKKSWEECYIVQNHQARRHEKWLNNIKLLCTKQARPSFHSLGNQRLFAQIVLMLWSWDLPIYMYSMIGVNLKMCAISSSCTIRLNREMISRWYTKEILLAIKNYGLVCRLFPPHF